MHKGAVPLGDAILRGLQFRVGHYVFEIRIRQIAHDCAILSGPAAATAKHSPDAEKASATTGLTHGEYLANTYWPHMSRTEDGRDSP